MSKLNPNSRAAIYDGLQKDMLEGVFAVEQWIDGLDL